MGILKEKESNFITEEAYFTLLAQSDQRYEYHNGYVVAMAGGSRNHNVIALNVSAELRTRLRNKSCRPFTSDLKVFIPSINTYYFPDVFAVCGDESYYKDRSDTIENPVLVIEVLSPSTKEKDRIEKFTAYRSLPSFKEYVLIHQDKPYIETYFKQDNGIWQFNNFQGLEDVMKLQSLDVVVPLKFVYEDVGFEEEVSV